MDERELHDLLDRHASAAHVVGAAAGVLLNDRIITAQTGDANIDADLPVNGQTRFHVVSVTKVMVATVIARLADLGRLSLDDPVGRHVPEVRVAAWSSTVTLRHLLSNTAGIPVREEWDQEYDAEGDDCLAHLASEIAAAPPLWTPGTLWGYTNLAWCLLGRAIEVVTHSTFEDAMRAELLDRLEMTETRFDHEGSLEPASRAYEYAAGETRVQNHWHRRALGPAGGTVWSTVEDLLSLVRLHLSDGALPDGQTYTRPGVLAGLRGVHATPRLPDWLDDWCLGLGRWRWPGATGFGWDGVGVGFRSILRFIPERKAAFVLLTNTSTGRKMYRDVVRDLVPRLGGGSIAPDRLEPAALPPDRLVRFEGVYGVPDHHVTVRSTGDRLAVDGLEGIAELHPIEDRIFLVDPDGADVRTVVFATDGLNGHPRAVYDLVWALPRIASV